MYIEQMAEDMKKVLDDLNLEFDFDKGSIQYKCSLIMTDIHPIYEMLQETFLMSYKGYTRYIEGLKRVIAGTASPKDAINISEDDDNDPQGGASVQTFAFADGSEIDAYFFENGRFGGFSHRRTGEEDEEDEYEVVTTMNIRTK